VTLAASAKQRAPQHLVGDEDHTEGRRVFPDANFNLRKMETRRKLAKDRQGA
jgi:hypothetical protein